MNPASTPTGTWWCNSHQREATHTRADGTRCCDPKLGGILLPCFVVHAPMTIEKSKCPVWPEGSGEWTYRARRHFAATNCTFAKCCLRQSRREIDRCYIVPEVDFPAELARLRSGQPLSNPPTGTMTK
jgi:hypothetical protein